MARYRGRWAATSSRRCRTRPPPPSALRPKAVHPSVAPWPSSRAAQPPHGAAAARARAPGHGGPEVRDSAGRSRRGRGGDPVERPPGADGGAAARRARGVGARYGLSTLALHEYQRPKAVTVRRGAAGAEPTAVWRGPAKPVTGAMPGGLPAMPGARRPTGGTAGPAAALCARERWPAPASEASCLRQSRARGTAPPDTPAAAASGTHAGRCVPSRAGAPTPHPGTYAGTDSCGQAARR